MHDFDNVTITPEILKLIAAIDEFKGTTLSAGTWKRPPLRNVTPLMAFSASPWLKSSYTPLTASTAAGVRTRHRLTNANSMATFTIQIKCALHAAMAKHLIMGLVMGFIMGLQKCGVNRQRDRKVRLLLIGVEAWRREPYAHGFPNLGMPVH